MARYRGLLLCACALAAALLACDDEVVQNKEKPPAGLSPKQAAAVLAKVGDKTITLGDFAAALERMDQFDRLRFETTKRRGELLQQLIDIELLSQEARRRGLDKDPAVQEAIRQVLRDALLAKARDNVPAPAQISQAEVNAYYERHKTDFQEPERRRVAAIVVGAEAKAAAVLAEALVASGEKWGDLVFEHSLTAPKERSPHAPPELAGDLDIVGPPGDARGQSEKVPEAVRKAVFSLAKVGDVAPAPVKVDDRYFIVRLTGLSQAHTRTAQEADRAIRVAIIQQKIREHEAELEAGLRKKYAVQIDEAALAQIKLPAGVEGYQPYWQRDGAQSAKDAGREGDAARRPDGGK